MTYRTERIFILSAILLIGLGLILTISRGALGAASAASAGLLWSLTAALAIVAYAGSLWLRSGAQLATASGPSAPSAGLGRRSRYYVPLEPAVPALLVIGFTLFIQIFENGIVQTLIIAPAALSFAAVYWAQLHSIEVTDRYFSLSNTILNIISHLCAFLLFATIYGLKIRSVISATAVGVVTLLLVFELLSRDAAWHRAMKLPVEGRRSTIMLLSVVCGLLLAELTWGLNYWAALTTLIGGAFLLVAFYVTYGLISHYVDHKLTRQTILEFSVVGLVGIAAVFASAFLGF